MNKKTTQNPSKHKREAYQQMLTGALPGASDFGRSPQCTTQHCHLVDTIKINNCLGESFKISPFKSIIYWEKLTSDWIAYPWVGRNIEQLMLFTTLQCTALHIMITSSSPWSHYTEISIYYTAQQWTALHCTALHCTALHCTTYFLTNYFERY